MSKGKQMDNLLRTAYQQMIGEKKSGMEDDTRKVKNCDHPEHNPPMHIHIPYGKRYRHICPMCKHETMIYSSEPSYGVMQ